MKEVIEVLESVKSGIDFEKENDLIESGILDSFDIVTLVSKLNDEFDIEIGVSEVIPENFASAKAIYEMVKRLEDE